MGKPAFALLAVLAFLVPCLAQTASSAPSSTPAFSLGGQLSLQSSARFDTALAPFVSLRFIPELKFTTASAARPDARVIFDAEASVNAYGSTSRFEARIGLQKVSFGSAALFRPMMWFDSMDPRDPLQLTDGVYALLLRYYTKGNASFWAWTMYGNDARRGFDLAPPVTGN